MCLYCLAHERRVQILQNWVHKEWFGSIASGHLRLLSLRKCLDTRLKRCSWGSDARADSVPLRVWLLASGFKSIRFPVVQSPLPFPLLTAAEISENALELSPSDSRTTASSVVGMMSSSLLKTVFVSTRPVRRPERVKAGSGECYLLVMHDIAHRATTDNYVSPL